ncbi:MAG TPA: hypothetical protein VNU23_02045 [Candidatus Cybelea sp.]|nr:hypothetical protein [Candidatus Cybelea sp.]
MTYRKLACLVLLFGSLTAPPLLASPRSTAAFQKLLSLAGAWEGKDDHGMVAKTTFKAMAGNTAVMETLAMSGMDEMVSLYSVDQDRIALVHYCPTNNQPRMRATPDSDDVKELNFEFQGAANLPPDISITWSFALRMLITSRKLGPGVKTTKIPSWSFTLPANSDHRFLTVRRDLHS